MATIAPNTPSSPAPQGGGMTTQTPESRRRSGSFTNLQSYIRANRGAAGQMAESVASDIEERSRKAVSDIETAGSDFTSRVDEATPDATAEEFRSSIEGIRGGGDAQRALEIGRSLSEAQLPGAEEFDISESVTEGRRAERDARGLGQTQGLQNVVRSRFGTPGYTRGQQRLDTFLLQGSQPARERLARTQQEVGTKASDAAETQFGNVQSALTAGQDRLRELQEAGRIAETEYDALRSEIEGQREQLATQVPQMQQDELNRILSNIESGFASQGEINNLIQFIAQGTGSTPEAVQDRLFGTTPENIRAMSFADFVNPEEAARLNALSRLTAGNFEGPDTYQAQEDEAAIRDMILGSDTSIRAQGMAEQAIQQFNQSNEAIKTQLTDNTYVDSGPYQGSLADSINQAYNDLYTGNIRPDVDAQKSANIVNKINDTVNQYNQFRSQYGLTPVDPLASSPIDERTAARNMVKNALGSAAWNNPNSTFSNPGFVRDRLGVAGEIGLRNFVNYYGRSPTADELAAEMQLLARQMPNDPQFGGFSQNINAIRLMAGFNELMGNENIDFNSPYIQVGDQTIDTNDPRSRMILPRQ